MSVSASVSTSISSATTATPVVTSDADVISPPGRALYVGGTGDVTVRMAGGGNATFSGVPTGAILPICVDQVLATGTSASNLLLLR